MKKPFLFRAVNAKGSYTEQTQGGFESDQFWIAPAPHSATLTSTLSTTTLKSAHAPTTSGAGKKVSSTTATPAPTGGSGGLSSGAKEGIGAGIGIGLGIALIAGLAFFLWRRRQKKKQEQQWPQQQQQQVPPVAQQQQWGQQPYSDAGSYSQPMDPSARQSYMGWQSQSPPPSVSQKMAPYPPQSYGLPPPQQMNSPVEAPSFQEPQEMAGEYHDPGTGLRK